MDPMIYLGLVAVSVFILGVAVGYGPGTDRRRDLLVEALAERAMARMDGLPEPSDEEIGEMMAAAMLAQDTTPFAFVVMALGTALLRQREAGTGT